MEDGAVFGSLKEQHASGKVAAGYELYDIALGGSGHTRGQQPLHGLRTPERHKWLDGNARCG